MSYKKRRRNNILKDVGMGALDMTLGSVASLVTGQDISTMTGYDYNTKVGQGFDKYSDIKSSVSAAAAPMLAGVAGTAVGIPPSVSSGAMTALQGGVQPYLPDAAAPTMFKMGGKMQQSYAGGGELTEFNGGGSHEMNPMGGIPQGPNALVEAGETKFNSEDYIFSDRIKVDENTATEFKLPKLKGSTYADLSKKIKDKYTKVERDNDTFGKESLEKDLKKLSEKQESFKQKMFEKHMQKAMEFAPQNVASPEQNPMTEFAMGGKIKYDGISNPSGYLPLQNGAGYSPFNIFSADQLAGMDGNMPSQFANVNTQGIPPMSAIDNSLGLDSFMGEAASQKSFDKYTSGEIDAYGNNTNPMDISRMLEYAPAAANVAQMAYAMANKPEVYAEDRYNIDNPFEASTIDFSPIKEDINNASNTSFRNAQGASGGSRALTQTANLEINRNRNKALSDVNFQKQGFDASEKARIQQGTAEIDRINTMLERGMLDKNEANRALYEAYIHSGIGSLGKNIGSIAGENTDAKMVEKTFQFNPYTGEKIPIKESKYGGYLRKKRTKKTK